MKRVITMITTPCAIEPIVSKILHTARFNHGTEGGGEITWEREGHLTAKEKKQLQAKLAKALLKSLSFEVATLPEQG